MGYAPTLKMLVPIQFLVLKTDFQQLCTHGSTAAAVTLHSKQHTPSLLPIRLSLNSFLCTASLSVFLENTTAWENAPAQVGVAACCKVAVLI